jgi:trans-aconitate methyltransferase
MLPLLGMARRCFDAGYYRRFYLDRGKRVASPQATEALVEFVGAYLRLLDVRVRTVLDLGCGLGWWKAPIERCMPGARWTGVEVSEHLCETLGWARGSVVDWKGPAADLVVCQGVLQYLDEREVKRALANLKRLAKKAIYLEAVTLEDWEKTVDRKRSDPEVALRPAELYRRALSTRFVHAGGGLWLRRSEATLFALERA